MRPGRPRRRQSARRLACRNTAARGTPQELALPAGGGDRNAVPLYTFANQRIVDHFIPDMPLRVSALRTLGGFGNVFALESMMDEVAAAAGADPVAFRLKHLEDPRARAVLPASRRKAAGRRAPKAMARVVAGSRFCRYETTKILCRADCRCRG